MAAYPFLVQSAWHVLQAICIEWQKDPFRWINERSIQAEIGGRLNQIFSLQGFGKIEGQYKWASPGFPKENRSWDRVSYEPPVYFLDETNPCYPDIVIWDNDDQDQDSQKEQLWSILWACEIKYGAKVEGKADFRKLTRLLDQGVIKYGCSFNVHHSFDPTDIAVKWSNNQKGHHLWVCDVRMPQNQK
jgi:hypothetical protein